MKRQMTPIILIAAVLLLVAMAAVAYSPVRALSINEKAQVVAGCIRHSCKTCGGSPGGCDSSKCKSLGDKCGDGSYSHDQTCYISTSGALGSCNPSAYQLCFKYKQCNCNGKDPIGNWKCNTGTSPEKVAKTNHSNGPCQSE